MPGQPGGRFSRLIVRLSVAYWAAGHCAKQIFGMASGNEAALQIKSKPGKGSGRQRQKQNISFGINRKL